MPITCHQPLKDLLFHILFVRSPESTRALIEASVLNIAKEYNTPGIHQALQLLRPAPFDSIHKLQAKFFILLNEDEAMRRRLNEPQSAYISALCPYKAERFYDSLCDTILPNWMKDESRDCASLIDEIRRIYLLS